MKKLILVILGWFMIALPATNAQEVNNILTLNEQQQGQEKTISLEESLRYLEGEHNVNFIYKSDLVKEKSISKTLIGSEDLESILTSMIRQFDIQFKKVGDRSFFLAAAGEPIEFRQEEVTGTVYDAESGDTLPGVNIMVKGTNIGTATGPDGSFELTVPSLQDTLVATFVGYERQEIPLDGRSQLDIQLSAEAIMGDEMVVTGYTNTMNRKELSGAVSTVDMEDLSQRKVSSVSEALQGQVSGVQVSQSTGAPGDEVEIRIRGEGTIGNNNPLFVVDGVPTRSIGFLNPADIQSMNVLKDASAAAIYGSRSSGGVIVIETKQGREGESELNVNYYSGVSGVSNLPNMLNSQQYMNTVEEAWNNAGYSGTNPYTQDKGRSDFANTDWLGETFGPGYTHNVSLSARGGNENTNYYLSSRYYTEDGVVVYDNDKIQIMDFRANVNSDVTDRFTLGTNMQLSYSNEDNLNSRGDQPGIVRHAMLRPPILSVKKDPDDPYYSEEDPFTDLPFYEGPNDYESGKYELSQNPVALAYFTDDVIQQYKAFGNLFGEYSFLEDENLTFRTNLGVDVLFYHHKVFNENFGDDDGGGQPQDAGLGRQNRPNSLSQNRDKTINITWSNTLNYTEDFGKHGVNGLVGTEFVSNRSTNVAGSRQRFDFSDDNFRYLNFGSTETGLTNSGTGSEWALFSYFGSASYDYAERYMVTANLRADASSRFADNYKWGLFPSFSAGWMMSEESFLENVDWLSQLKLRGSWGQLGNQEIPNYAYLTLLQRNASGQYEVSRYGNPNLKWETTTQTNFGIDAILFERLSFSAEYFNMLTSDILLPITLPEVVGEVQPTFVNSGEVRNKGFEFSASYRKSEGAFKYRVNANFSTLTNTVEKLHPNLPSIINNVTRTEVGKPINSYYGFVMEGIYQNQQEVDSHLSGESNPSAQPGDIKFKDLDGNGIINSDDRTFIGDPHPDFTYGLNFTGEYKNIDLSVFLQGVQGVDQYNDSKKILDYDTRPFNYTTRVLDSWDGEGSTNSIPRLSFTDNGSSRVSSIYVEDASYMRIKNVEVGYTFDGLFGGNQSKVKNLRLYVSGQNLLTITDYTGLDPEVTDLMDYGTYPQSRTIMVGINASF
ncbi:SusC/RagA family TonB-linked outer membrane protein [Aliifodinibius salipaludis]|nr:SusC/RagA family TonB-linked outer membrane protein [Aliifodinibius salipaludis]